MTKLAIRPTVTIRTIGEADLHEEIIFASEQPIQVGDLIDLKITKPEDASVYGQARVTQYLSWNGRNPTKFRAYRIQ